MISPFLALLSLEPGGGRAKANVSHFEIVRFPPITDITNGSGCISNDPYCFNRYPVLNTHAMPARHSAMIATITITLDHTGTSATPKKVQRKPLTR